MIGSTPTHLFDQSQLGGCNDSEKKAVRALTGLNIVLTALKYYDQQAKLHHVVGCFYEPVHANVPTSLVPLFPAPRPAYEVRDSPGKGKGLYATRDIQPGELVVIERALIIIPILLTNGHGMSLDKLLDTIIARLSEEDRALFFSLSNAKGASFKMNHAWGILSTNAIGVDFKGVPDAEGHAAVFPIISRVNHSCGPNSTWNFDHAAFAMRLQATRYISASEEITAGYCSLDIARVERLSELESKYHFNCNCPHCHPLSLESDHRRAVLRAWPETYVTYAQWIANPSRKLNELSMSSVKALVLVRMEGIEGEFAHRHYEDLAKSYGALGDKKKMRDWGWKFLLAYKAYPLRKDEHLATWVDWLRDPPRYFPDWNKAAKK